MAGEPDYPYTITPARMVLDNRFSGADAAAAAVGSNVVQVTPVRPFQSEERPRAGRIIEPASAGRGRNPHSTTYVWKAEDVNRLSTGLRLETFGER
jgi:hypothetical protein